jgi:hypothetical protein
VVLAESMVIDSPARRRVPWPSTVQQRRTLCGSGTLFLGNQLAGFFEKNQQDGKRLVLDLFAFHGTSIQLLAFRSSSRA